MKQECKSLKTIVKKILIILSLCSVTIIGATEDQEVWLLNIIERADFECRRLDTVKVNGFKDGLITRYAVWCENKSAYAYDFFEIQYWEEHSDWCVTGTIDGKMKEVCMEPKTGKITSCSGNIPRGCDKFQLKD